MARKGNPISTRLHLNRSSDSAWFTDCYYTDFVSQDVNLRSYFGSVHRPKTKKKNWGFRLGRSFIFHFPKRTLIHFFFPRLNQRIKTRIKTQIKTRIETRVEKLKEKRRKLLRKLRKLKKKNRFKIKVKRASQSQKGQRRKKANRLDRIMDTLSNLRKLRKKLHKLEKLEKWNFLDQLKRWWKWKQKKLYKFDKVGPMGCLHDDTAEEERKEVIGQEAGKRVESIRLDDREKLKADKGRPKKKQGYGYHDRSPSIKRKRILSKLLQVGAFPKYAEKKKNINRLELLKKNNSFRLRKTKYSLHFLVMQYFFLNAKNKIKLNPVIVLNHLVARDVSELSTQRKKSRSASFKRIRSRIAFFVENLTSEKGSFSEAKKEFTRLIVQANDLRFARTTKTTISLFPFFGAPFFFLMNELGPIMLGGVHKTKKKEKKLSYKYEYARKNIRQKLEKELSLLLLPSVEHLSNLLPNKKEKKWKWNAKCLDPFLVCGGKRFLLKKAFKILGGILLQRRIIPYGYNRYLNAVKRMEYLLSNRTNSNTNIMKSVKIRSIYQSASMIAQEISLRLKKLKKRSFRKTYTHFAHNIPIVMKKRVLGIRISCSGRLKGKPIASTYCGKYGKTSGNVFNQKIDYAFRKVSTRYGILGVKVWISYTN
uniref:Small ribosomal subunit protein uS3m n=1 Tax=Erodium texanum TaxID=28960 RepID=A0A0G3B9E3_EROTE|nr:ribosomal protein S3 [Erodium texanum]